MARRKKTEDLEEFKVDEQVEDDSSTSIEVSHVEESSDLEVKKDEPEEDGHEWHKIEENDETFEDRPDWDDEKWDHDESSAVEKNVNNTDVDEPEEEGRPDWDEEKWAHKSELNEEELDHEKEERPEWDEEKWAHKAETPSEEDDKSEKLSLKAKIFSLISFKKKRNLAFAGMALFLVVMFSLPVTRYSILNTTGARAQASINIFDAQTRLPLINAEVTLGNVMAMTDDSGYAYFDSVKYGTQELSVRKSAYQEYTKSVTITGGDNAIGEIELNSIGNRFEFSVVDWLSEIPIEGATISYGESSALSDDEGKVSLALPSDSPVEIDVLVEGEGYREEVVKLNTTSGDLVTVKLVVQRDHYFISKRDGRYDVYKISADGNNEARVLRGTGNERASLNFSTSLSGDHSILVATRNANNLNEDNYLLSGMFVIDNDTGEFKRLELSERIDIVGWVGDWVVYVKIQSGASRENPERQRLMAYDTQSDRKVQIAANNYFNDIIVADDNIIYAPSDYYSQNPQSGLFRASVDNSTNSSIFQENVWTILRTGIKEISFNSDQDWYQGNFESENFDKMTTRPQSYNSRLYTTNPSGTKSAWVDYRDGKGVLLVNDKKTNNEIKVVSMGGLRDPVVWLSDSHLVFRINTSDETADYVINIDDGEARKISDVTNVTGVDRWYYY